VTALDMARQELVALCRRLGEPGYHFAILGEGNAGVAIDGVQLVTASGSRLGEAQPDDVVALDRDALLEALDSPLPLDDESWTRAVAAATTASDGRAATIEAPLHAVA
jgi:ribulose-5-phosphate 4-epimerase/fuculose-1-phosphate aldolase